MVFVALTAARKLPTGTIAETNKKMYEITFFGTKILILYNALAAISIYDEAHNKMFATIKNYGLTAWP